MTSIGTINVANTDSIEFTIYKDGVIWNLTGAAVYLLWKKQLSSIVEEREMTIDSAAGGLVSYLTEVTDFTVAGTYLVSARVEVGTVVKTYPFRLELLVTDRP